MRLIAALSISLPDGAAPVAVQLFPAGEFRARDGRPGNVPAWKMDAGIAAKLIVAAKARATPYVIDYEHQTLLSEQNGQPAPAAAWFNGLEWRPGDGLYATGVQWTARAAQMVEAGEYKFLSPVFAYDKAGAVQQLYHVGLTNTPALDGMDALLAAAKFSHPEKDTPAMNELKALFGLKDDADEAAVLAAAKALKTQADASAAQIAALKTQTPDPAKFVPVETMTALQTQVAALSARINDGEVDEVVKAALAAGKLVPAQEPWARSLGKTDLAALKTYVETAPAIAALKGTQTGGKGPDGLKEGELDEAQLAVCRQMGVNPDDFKKTLAAQAAA